VGAIRGHLHAAPDYQNKLARFLENHDEPRISDTLGPDRHKAAAIITFCCPGLRFFHQGQFEGRMKRISPHLIRAPHEPLNTDIQEFYMELLSVIKLPVLRDGVWQLLECVPAWDGNGSCDSFVSYAWQGTTGERILIIVNYASHPSQSYLRLPFADLAGAQWRLQDLMSEASYGRDGNTLQSRGLYLDMHAWQYHIFEMKRTGDKP
jgi:hypothetical protein